MRFSIQRRILAALLSGTAFTSAALAHGADLPTSCTDAADAAFDEGLNLLHNMMYIQAEAAFEAASAADPDCAMAQWGIAMANFHPLWPGGPMPDETVRGTAAAERLAGLSADTDLERDLIAAVAAFYTPGLEGYRARIAAWAEAQNKAYEQNHDNIDAAAFAALAWLSTAPGGEAGAAAAEAAGDLLDRLHEEAPHHPGVIHYAIHAYDSPANKDRGIPYAQIYDKTAPTAPHALHMPSHIFTRTGDWEASIDLNRRSADAALEQSGEILENHYVHAIDYMVYGYLQLGKSDEAKQLVDDMLARTNHEASFGGAYALAASPVRLVLEAEKWDEAARLSTDLHPNIPWENFPQTVAMLWFAKGLGAARSGDVTAARAATERLGELRTTMLERDQGYWAQLTEAQILTVEAWIELTEGQGDLALSLQTQAADLEDAIGKSPVTPGHVLPARELLGDMLLVLSRPDEAAQAYNASLAVSPNRARSLKGLEVSGG